MTPLQTLALRRVHAAARALFPSTPRRLRSRAKTTGNPARQEARA